MYFNSALLRKIMESKAPPVHIYGPFKVGYKRQVQSELVFSLVSPYLVILRRLMKAQPVDARFQFFSKDNGERSLIRVCIWFFRQSPTRVSIWFV